MADELLPPNEGGNSEPPDAEGSRRRSRKIKETELIESERVALARILTEHQHKGLKIDAELVNKCLDLVDRQRARDDESSLKLWPEIRQYLYFLKEHNINLADQQTKTQAAVLENINKIGELTKALGEASGGSKAKEAVEVIGLVLQFPILQMFQDMIVEWVEERKNKKKVPQFKGPDAQAKRREWILAQRKLEALKAELEQEEEPEELNGAAPE